MPTPIEKACQFLIANAQPKSIHKCAQYVRTAIDYGFNSEGPGRIILKVIGAAKNCGPAYEAFGFKKVFSFPAQKKEDYKEQIGDVCIIQYEPFGHICMKTPKGWCSDFPQIDRYGGSIRKSNPSFDIYRYGSAN